MASIASRTNQLGNPTTLRRFRLSWTSGLLGLVFTALSAATGLAANSIPMLNLNQFQQQDLRALSMGNAFGSIARGETALQYNPAGLATYDFDLKVDASATYMGERGKFVDDTLKVTSGNPTNQDVVNYLNKYDGTTQTYVLQTFPSAVANLGEFNLGLGIGNLDVQRYQIQFLQTTAGVVSPADSFAVSEDRAQLALGGIGFKLFQGKALFGVTSKTVRYTESSSVIPFAQLLASSKINFNMTDNTYNQVQAYDAGFIYRVEWLPALKPQWSLSAYNIGGYTLKSSLPAANPRQQLYVPDSYNFGMSLQPDFGFVHVLMSAEYEDIGAAIKVPDANNVNQPRDSAQQIHAGVEVGLFKTPTGNNWLSVRGGSNGGYVTYGAEVNLGGFLRGVYSYGTENFGYKGHPTIFKFEAYQLALGIAW
jgi:hypothetical protein